MKCGLLLESKKVEKKTTDRMQDLSEHKDAPQKRPINPIYIFYEKYNIRNQPNLMIKVRLSSEGLCKYLFIK